MTSEPMLFSIIKNDKAVFYLLMPISIDWQSLERLWGQVRPKQEEYWDLLAMPEKVWREFSHGCRAFDMKPVGLATPGLVSDLQNKLENRLLYFLMFATQSWSEALVGPVIVHALKIQMYSNEIDIFMNNLSMVQFHSCLCAVSSVRKFLRQKTATCWTTT